MNEEEIKNDIKEFNNLRNQISMLWKELDADKEKQQLLTGQNRKDFIDALSVSTDFVADISDFYDELEEKYIYNLPCNFDDPKDKNAKLVRKLKKKKLDTVKNQVKYLIKHPVLVTLFLEVTLRCNAKCEHCGSSCGYDIPKDEITAEELKKALLEIHEKYDSKQILLSVTGGEPLLRKDLFEIMEYAVNLGFHWGMTTNGILINKRIIQKMEETNFETISISLDGLRETHDSFRKVPGAFDKIMKSIKLLQGLKTLKILQITTIANKKNINELEDIYNLLLKLGIKYWRVANVDPIGRAANNTDILLNREEMIRLFQFIKEKRKEGKMEVEFGCSHYLGLKYENDLRSSGPFYCGTGISIGSILSNGDIGVCPDIRDKKFIQGNIKKDSFVDVWENKYKEFRTERITVNDKCSQCKSFKYCRGGAFHTWNFDENVPNMCMKELLGKDFVE